MDSVLGVGFFSGEGETDRQTVGRRAKNVLDDGHYPIIQSRLFVATSNPFALSTGWGQVPRVLSSAEHNHWKLIDWLFFGRNWRISVINNVEGRGAECEQAANGFHASCICCRLRRWRRRRQRLKLFLGLSNANVSCMFRPKSAFSSNNGTKDSFTENFVLMNSVYRAL